MKVAGCGALLLCLLPAMAAAQANVVLTNVPDYGSSGEISGRVTGVSPGQYNVHVRYFIPDDGWFTTNCPGVSPDEQGNFRVNAVGLGLDRASKFAVLVVAKAASVPCTYYAEGLPQILAGNELGRLVVTRSNPNARTIRFSGMDWIVKSSTNMPVGPGANYFPGSADNVFLDAQGRLHMKITAAGSAEVIASRSLGFGRYRIYLDTPATTFHPSAVLGFFTWSEDPAQAHREIDLEITQWGDPGNQNGQFVLQPYTEPNNIRRFTIPGLPQTSYEFVWMPDRVDYAAISGHTWPRTPGNTTEAWSTDTRATGIPAPGDERLRINFYRASGKSIVVPQEVIISKVEYLPLAPLPVTAHLRIPIPQQGVKGTVAVNTTPGAPWRLDVPAWIQPFPTSGIGSADVWYSVLPNFRAEMRSAVVPAGAGSIEFQQARHGGTVEQRFAAAMYYNILGRVPSEEEADFQVLQALFKGVARADLANNFFASEEFNLAGRFVAGLCVGLLNRDPEFGGWLFQRNALTSGQVTPVQLVENFLGSPEYRLNFGTLTNDQFVTNLYRYILGRVPSAPELNGQVGALVAGTSRVQLATAFLNSAEFRLRVGPRLTAFLLYATILQRDATQGERDWLAALIQGGTPVRTVLDGFLGGEEFRRILE